MGRGYRKNHTSGFEWSLLYTLVWELRPELRALARFEGGGGVSSETSFVCITGLLHTLAMACAHFQIRIETFYIYHIRGIRGQYLCGTMPHSPDSGGQIGTYFADRKINSGAEFKQCNIWSWLVNIRAIKHKGVMVMGDEAHTRTYTQAHKQTHTNKHKHKWNGRH